MKKSHRVRYITKTVIFDRHIRACRYNFNEPPGKNDGKIITFIRDDNCVPELTEYNRPVLDYSELYYQESESPGNKQYRLSLGTFDSYILEATLNSEQNVSQV